MDPYLDIVHHYEERYDEGRRLLDDPVGVLELIRTRLILERHLPSPPATVLDVGGGPGIYAAWLAATGYDVEIIDIVPRHIQEATEKGIRATLGDARDLPRADQSCDAVLLLGPLYHLTDHGDRLQALAEAVRVAKPGAPVFAAAISRYAPAIDGLDAGYIDDPAFAEIMNTDLDFGTHFNPTGNPGYFTTAFFHHPDGLREEFMQAGLRDVSVLAVEGIGWADSDLGSRLEDNTRLGLMLDLLTKLETEPSIIGASPHLLAIGWTDQLGPEDEKPGQQAG